MSDYRRCFVSGGTYFFTLVTFERRPLFADALARRCLREVMVFVQQRNSFSMPGICLLPDHLHCIWTLPAGDEDFSLRWNMVKGLFSKRFRTRGGQVGMVGASRHKRREVGVWQRRFWEHLISDEGDYQRHLDYLHFNPVKHRLVGRVVDWPWSSFHQFVEAGVYPADWGGGDVCGSVFTTVGE